MKSTVEQLSPTRVKVNVEVPFDELKPNFDRAYKKIAQQVNVPGFRPGKAPARVLESRVGRAPVLDEVVNEAIPAKYMEAVQGEDMRTLGQPEFEVTKLEDKDTLEFSAEVDIRPQITLPEFDDISVSVDNAELEESEVDEQLDTLRARFGTLTGVDRPAADGDFVSIDLSAEVDGQEIEEAATSGLSYQVGSGDLVDGIDEAITGMSAGETSTFTTQLMAGEYTGRDAEVTVTVESVKERELPEADDEFAQMASEFDTLEELRENLRSNLGQRKTMNQGEQARDKVLDELLERTEVPIPEKVVEDEVGNRKEQLTHQFNHDEEALARALEAQGKTVEEFDAENREEAEKEVRQQLLLDSLADELDVQPGNNELMERIMYQAQQAGVKPEEYIQQAQQSGQLGAIYADVRRGKALATVLRKATVTDESGNEVDLSEVLGPEEDEQPDTVEGDTVEGDTVEGDSAETNAAEESDASQSADGEQAQQDG